MDILKKGLKIIKIEILLWIIIGFMLLLASCKNNKASDALAYHSESNTEQGISIKKSKRLRILTNTGTQEKLKFHLIS